MPAAIIDPPASVAAAPGGQEGEGEERQLLSNDSERQTSEVDDARTREQEADEVLAAAPIGDSEVPQPRDAESIFERIVAGGIGPRGTPSCSRSRSRTTSSG